MDAEQLFNPADVAHMLGTSGATIRRWSEWHAEHLSPTARPGLHKERRFTAHDIEVLRAVQNLRSRGMTTTGVNAQLRTVAIGDIMRPEEPPQPIVAAQESPSAPLVPAQVSEYLLHRLDRIEQRQAEAGRQQRDRFMIALYGFLAGAVLMMVIFWLAYLLARLAG